MGALGLELRPAGGDLRWPHYITSPLAQEGNPSGAVVPRSVNALDLQRLAAYLNPSGSQSVVCSAVDGFTMGYLFDPSLILVTSLTAKDHLGVIERFDHGAYRIACVL